MFQVIIQPRAQADLQQAVDWWSEHHSREQAERWYIAILGTIATLSEMPRRCPIVPESEIFGRDVHQLLFGATSKFTHRIYFGIDGKTVDVFRVLHMSQQRIDAAEDLR